MTELASKNEQHIMGIQELYYALERAAEDLFSFAMVLSGARQEAAESAVLDTLFFALERLMIARGFGADQSFTHLEYREDLFKNVYGLIRKQSVLLHAGAIDSSMLGDGKQKFYQLGFQDRAAIFLRTKCKFAEDAIARIIALTPQEVGSRVAKSREFILGKSLKMKNLEEEF